MERDCFHLEIVGLDTFAAFVAIIRGETPDATALAQLRDQLKRSTDPLIAAEAAQPKDN